GDQHDARALLGEAQGDRTADSAAGARDEDGPILESHSGLTFPSSSKSSSENSSTASRPPKVGPVSSATSPSSRAGRSTRTRSTERGKTRRPGSDAETLPRPAPSWTQAHI